MKYVAEISLLLNVVMFVGILVSFARIKKTEETVDRIVNDVYSFKTVTSRRLNSLIHQIRGTEP